MCQFLRAAMCAVPTMALICLSGQAGGGDAKDLFQAKTLWKGEIRQGESVFPTTIYVHERDRGRIKGEIHFKTGSGLNVVTFEGTVSEGRTVAWITDRKEGTPTVPGLYVGKLDGKTITGTWQVPSANQFDRFTVKLVE